jgi:16S rRNA processing protein RimM
MTSANDSGDLVAVGRIVGVHGIRGELKVESLTDFPERFDAGSQLFLVTPDGKVRPTEILAGREHKGRILIALPGVTDRDAAEALRGSFLKIEEEDLTPLPPGRFYHYQLVDLSVVTDEGRDLGRVAEVIPTGGNLVLDVRGGGGEVLLPFIDDVILDVDLEAGKITVHLLEGLLPEDGS